MGMIVRYEVFGEDAKTRQTRQIMKLRAVFILSLAVNLTAAMASLAQPTDATKRVISFSGPPDARVFHDNVVEMERLMPVVDGVTLYPVTDNGGVVTEALGRLFRADFHRLEDFDSGIELMTSANTRIYRDNFLLVYLTTGVVEMEVPDWLDPEFDAVTNNWKVAAEYARRAGMRGLLFDDEAYYGRNLWTYQRLKYTSTTTADDYHDTGLRARRSDHASHQYRLP